MQRGRAPSTSHVLLPQVDPSCPATFSRAILQGLLRENLGFQGVIVSDALDMKGASGDVGIAEAAVLALAAGCDLLCIGTDNTEEQLNQIESAIVTAIDDGRLGADRLAEAVARNALLGRELRADAASIPIPEYVTADYEPEFDLARTIVAFDVQPAATLSTDRVLVIVEAAANIAVGASPWGRLLPERTCCGWSMARRLTCRPGLRS